MAKPQQPEMVIPEDNLPGHHPAHEQDKPIEAFVQKAKELAAEPAPDERGAEPIPIRPIPEVQAPTPARPPGVGAIVPAVAALDAVRHPQQAWDEIGESRTAWLTRISLVPLAAWRYDTRVRPRLEAAELALSLSGG